MSGIAAALMERSLGFQRVGIVITFFHGSFYFCSSAKTETVPEKNATGSSL